MPLSVGDKLGPYEILASIGAGGMGKVYRARDTKLDGHGAIKVLPAAFLHHLEGCRCRHPHSERSASRVQEATVRRQFVKGSLKPWMLRWMPFSALIAPLLYVAA